MGSKAVTKLQTVILISIVVIAGLVGVAAYVLLSGQDQFADTIKIGVLADLDGVLGKPTLQAAILAAEQINAEGGILGRTVEVIGEDTDQESGILDVGRITSALNRLLSFHEVDYIYSIAPMGAGITVQNIIAEHKTITFSSASANEFTERVLDDYDTHKYFFRVGFNQTSANQGKTESLLLLREQTGFNKVGYLAEAFWGKETRERWDYEWPEVYGFDLVYKGTFPWGTMDFTSYFAQAEAAGVEILVPLVAYGGVPLTKEWYNRQSPMLVRGLLTTVAEPESWDQLDGKCEHVVVSTLPIIAEYPLTSKTLPAREAYIARWGETPAWPAANAYDTLRFILPDAIERAGTTETEAVIKALEETSIETTSTKNFVFTSSHDMMMGENPNNPDEDYMLVCVFQWQNGELVPVHPKKIMEEAGATYTYPDWPGPWD